MSQSPIIVVDADACPVKDEVYRVAERYGLPVTIVANQFIRIPDDPLISRVIVSDGFDAADDWIVDHAHEKTLVVTTDILLAERCLVVGAAALSPKGVPFTENSIGAAVATRAIMADLRAGGDQIGGPAPFTKGDRSRFLQAMDAAARRLLRV